MPHHRTCKMPISGVRLASFRTPALPCCCCQPPRMSVPTPSPSAAAADRWHVRCAPWLAPTSVPRPGISRPPARSRKTKSCASPISRATSSASESHNAPSLLHRQNGGVSSLSRAARPTGTGCTCHTWKRFCARNKNRMCQPTFSEFHAARSPRTSAPWRSATATLTSVARAATAAAARTPTPKGSSARHLPHVCACMWVCV